MEQARIAQQKLVENGERERFEFYFIYLFLLY